MVKTLLHQSEHSAAAYPTQPSNNNDVIALDLTFTGWRCDWVCVFIIIIIIEKIKIKIKIIIIIILSFIRSFLENFGGLNMW